MLIDLYLQGRLDLDRFVSETIALDDVEEAFDEDAPRRGAALGGGLLMARARSSTSSRPGTFSLDGGTWDVDNNVWLVGDDHEVLVDRRRPRRRRRSSTAVGGPPGRRHRLHPRPQRPHQRRRRAGGSRPDAPIAAAPGRPDAVGRGLPRPRPDDRPRRRRRASTSPAPSVARAAHPGPLRPAASASTPRSSAPSSRGDTLFQGGPGATGRSYSDFPTIIDSIRDAAAVPAGRDRRPHRARRRHDDRRRGAAPRASGSPAATDRPDIGRAR